MGILLPIWLNLGNSYWDLILAKILWKILNFQYLDSVILPTNTSIQWQENYISVCLILELLFSKKEHLEMINTISAMKENLTHGFLKSGILSNKPPLVKIWLNFILKLKLILSSILILRSNFSKLKVKLLTIWNYSQLLYKVQTKEMWLLLQFSKTEELQLQIMIKMLDTWYSKSLRIFNMRQEMSVQFIPVMIQVSLLNLCTS